MSMCIKRTDVRTRVFAGVHGNGATRSSKAWLCFIEEKGASKIPTMAKINETIRVKKDEDA